MLICVVFLRKRRKRCKVVYLFSSDVCGNGLGTMGLLICRYKSLPSLEEVDDSRFGMLKISGHLANLAMSKSKS